MNVGVIGYGYWGPNLVRNFNNNAKCKVKWLCDLDSRRLANAQSKYPSLQTTTDYQDILKDPGISAVAIATPVSSHYQIALDCLKAGKHVWVEKPMTATAEQGSRLVDEAITRNLVLHADHTFIYTPAVQRLKQMIDSKELGPELYYYDSIRVNLGLFQRDVDVIWDLAVHDLSIVDFLFPDRPASISAIGKAHVPGYSENTAFLTLLYDSNFIVHVNVSWLSPIKVRQVLIGGSEKMAIYNDLEPTEKLKIYDKGLVMPSTPEEYYDTMVGYRVGDMWAPNLGNKEALAEEVVTFLESIETGKPSPTGGEEGLALVRILESSTKSLQQNGTPLKVEL